MKSRVEVNLSAALPLQKDLTAQLTLQKNGFERKGQMTLKQGKIPSPVVPSLSSSWSMESTY